MQMTMDLLAVWRSDKLENNKLGVIEGQDKKKQKKRFALRPNGFYSGND